MKNITVSDILKATCGKLIKGDEALAITDISIDSKNIPSANTIFVPLKGERVDAHRFVGSAVENGAACVVISDDSESIMVDLKDAGVIIKVNDTLKALQDIATYYRKRLPIKLVAVTGSVGKTTTREMTAAALKPFGAENVYQTSGNRNSQTGVPLTIADIAGETVGVIELGMSDVGEIEIIANISKPDVAIITNIGVAHLMQLKTQENICKEKMSITKGLSEDGCIFLNGDDEYQRNYRPNITHKVYFYGEDECCDFRILSAKQLETGMEFVLKTPDNHDGYEIFIPVMGMHNVKNAAAAIGAAIVMGAEPKAVIASMAEFGGVKMRQQIVKKNGYTIIDDSYNANPDSMKAGLKVLADYKVNENGKRIALLADMKELGEDEVRFHKELGEYVAKLSIDMLVTVGELAKYINTHAADSDNKLVAMHTANNEEAADFLKKTLKEGDVLFVKGSRSMALDKVIDKI